MKSISLTRGTCGTRCTAAGACLLVTQRANLGQADIEAVCAQRIRIEGLLDKDLPVLLRVRGRWILVESRV